MEAYLGEEEIPHERIAKSLHRRLPRHQGDAGPLRLLLQEQGRAAAARRDRRAAALAARGAAGHRPRSPPARARTSRREAERPADDSGPFAALAFKVMSDPYVGKLTYFRVYSGKLESRRPRPQRQNRQDRADRAAADDARQQPRGDRGGLRGRHLRRRRPQGNRHRRHARRPRRADRAGEHRIPRDGDRGRDRAENQSRPGEDGQPPCSGSARRTRPSGSNPTRKPARP